MDQVKFVEDSLQKNLRDIVCLSKPYPFKFFKGCLPQILLGPFLNTWTHLKLPMYKTPHWRFLEVSALRHIIIFKGVFRTL